MKKILLHMLVLGLTAVVHAQGTSFTQFTAAPMLLNPAYTGSMNGIVRTNLWCRNDWYLVSKGMTSLFVGIDGRTKYFRNGDHLGIGGSITRYGARDGQDSRTSAGIGGLAYHHSVRQHKKRPASLSFGLQGGYRQYVRYISMTTSNQYTGGQFLAPQDPPERYVMTQGVINAGTSFSQKAGDKVNYVLGISVNNIVQSKDVWRRREIAEHGSGRQLTASAGGNILVGERLSLRPAVIYAIRDIQNDLLAGNEFSLRLGNAESDTRVSLGLWYRSGNFLAATAAASIGSLKVMISHGAGRSMLGSAAATPISDEFSVGYTIRSRADHKRPEVICDRF